MDPETLGIDLEQIVAQAAAPARQPEQSGWQGVGQGLAGMFGGGGQSAAYSQGASSGLDIVKKQLEARKLRDESLARDATLRKATAAFPDMPIEQIEFMVNTMQTGQASDFSSYQTGMKTRGEADLRARAAAASDPMLRNQLLQDKPVDLTKIEGGVAYDPTVAPAAQEMQLTPAAAADDVRQALVAGSQVTRNVASANEYDRRQPKVTGDPVAQHAAKKRIDATITEYEALIAEAATPAERAKLEQERDGKIGTIANGAAIPSRGGTIDDGAQTAANLWADDMKAAGMAPTEGEIAEAVRKLMRGEPLPVAPIVDSNDGRNPPQVFDPTTGAPVTDGGGNPSDAVRDALGPPIDYINGGSKTGAAPVRGTGFGNVRSGAVSGNPVRITTAAEHAALPAGTLFVDPGDGKVYRKR